MQIPRSPIPTILAKPLSWLLLATLFKQIVWLGLVPIWHFPDEAAHFAQVQNVVEVGKTNDTRSSDEVAFSQKLFGVLTDSEGNNSYMYHPEYNLEYSNTLIGLHEQEIISYPRKYTTEIGLKEATVYPPLYYLIASFGYRIFYDSDLITRVFSTRIVSIPLFICTVWLTYKIGVMVFKERKSALLLGVLVSFHPMFAFMGSSVNSDVLFNCLFTSFIFTSLLFLEKPVLKHGILFSLILLLGFLTKQQIAIGLLLIPILILFTFKRNNKPLRLTYKGTILMIAGATLFYVISKDITEIWRIVAYVSPDTNNKINDLTLYEHVKWTLDKTYHEVIPWYWGVFKWLGVTLPRWTNRIQMGILSLSGIGIALTMHSMVLNKKRSRFHTSLLYLLVSSLIYFISVTLWNWLYRKTHGTSFGIQGRYYFPLIAAHMTLILAGLKSIVSRLRSRCSHIPLQIILFLWWLVLHLVGVITFAKAYYYLGSVHTFIIQVSQYKPFIFKGDWWYVWFSLALISLVGLLISYTHFMFQSQKDSYEIK